MYKYKYVESRIKTMFNESDHREIIDKYSHEGWRFVSAIPSTFGTYGVIKKFDLVFEKKIEE